MASNTSTLNHPILNPLHYEKYDSEPVLPTNLYGGTPSQWQLPPDEGILQVPKKDGRRQRPIGRLMAFLKKKKTPAAKMNALQAQQEREEVEMLDEYRTMALYAVAFLSITTALASMSIYSESVIVKIAFLFPLITAPYAIVQRRQINKAAFLREDFIRLKSRMARLRQQNTKLQNQTDHLELHVADLEAAERDLAAILQKQGRTRQEVQQLVKENGEVVRKIQQLTESRKLLQLVKMASISHDNSHLQLNEDELNEFVQRLQIMSHRELDEHKVRKALRYSTSVAGVSSMGSDPLSLEEMSEYEAFTFPRRPSLEK